MHSLQGGGGYKPVGVLNES